MNHGRRYILMNPSRMLKSLVQLLQGDDDPASLAAGFALGAALGLVPKGNLFALLFFLLFFLFRLDKGLALLSAALFTPLAYLADPLAHRLGYAVLNAAPLEPAWRCLYNLPIVPWTRFNNTVVMGNLLLGLALFWPLYSVFRLAVLSYRRNWRERVNALPVVRALKGLRVVQLYREWTQ